MNAVRSRDMSGLQCNTDSTNHSPDQTCYFPYAHLLAQEMEPAIIASVHLFSSPVTALSCHPIGTSGYLISSFRAALLLSYIDAHTDAFIVWVSEAVAIPSVHKMSDWLAAQLRTVGVEVKQVDFGTHVMNGKTFLGKISSSPHKETVLIYGHFDVQPATKSDRWDTEPFILTQEDNRRLVGPQELGR
ncbi:hypothetical protein B0H13DRAFT_2548705 [Mycena leptocephala]|nr:hypothetical protein B0H13DRAFT_2548705 [Mycena leptocephala]